MATLISDELEFVADRIVHHLDYPSAVLSGLAPDPRHLDNGGFHCSLEDLRAHGNGGDYSDSRPNDRGFNPKYGAAFDVSLAAKDMIRAYGRVRTVWADHSDPRRVYVNAINCWDGSGAATRFDFDAGIAKYASPDHVWHVHGEIHRRFVRDPKAARAMVSMFAGESKAAWLASHTPPLNGDDMDWNDTFTSPSWTPARFGKNPPTYGTALILSAVRAQDAVTAVNTALAKLLAAYTAQDHVDEHALGESIAAALAPQILAGLPAGTALTAADVENAVRAVLRAGVGAT
jgi:hypothetical protein